MLATHFSPPPPPLPQIVHVAANKKGKIHLMNRMNTANSILDLKEIAFMRQCDNKISNAIFAKYVTISVECFILKYVY